ncbi:hypothetical protein JQ615_01090 [Bradyrhizobium jicamae]|uniref:Uncharacterized protein n=1 Tax=Bradyrhizobium jicamae TaxID=280332 RepID=A0ABS5FB17_9BRAD|nr:hypothetical protein [Bradyrhizobium jicamae]MBR0793976.1 hypothetical protein [Bradyrhizobium jicamae]
MSDDRALLRALRIERRLVRVYERKLRDLYGKDFDHFRKICRAEAVARCDAATGKSVEKERTPDSIKRGIAGDAL